MCWPASIDPARCNCTTNRFRAGRCTGSYCRANRIPNSRSGTNGQTAGVTRRWLQIPGLRSVIVIAERVDRTTAIAVSDIRYGDHLAARIVGSIDSGLVRAAGADSDSARLEQVAVGVVACRGEVPIGVTEVTKSLPPS